MRLDKHKSVIALAMFCAGVCVVLLCCNSNQINNLYRARMVYAYSPLPIITNEFGIVIQPKVKRQIYGNYQDPRDIPVGNLHSILSSRKKEDLIRKIRMSLRRDAIAEDDILYAVESIKYSISDTPIPVIEVVVQSYSPKLSVIVLRILLKELESDLESEDIKAMIAMKDAAEVRFSRQCMLILQKPKLIAF